MKKLYFFVKVRKQLVRCNRVREYTVFFLLDKLPGGNYNKGDPRVTFKRRGVMMKTSKEEILNAALVVFSQKGYEGALLRDISSLLGITKPALYKHYESKEALWNAMIDYVERYYSEHTRAASGTTVPDNWDEFRELSLRQIDFTLHDETVRRVRRLLTMEQFRNKRTADLATKHIVTDIETRYAEIFTGMMEKGLLETEAPELLAFRYTAPITMMIHMCDREPDREPEIIKKIDAHIRQFEDEHKLTEEYI